MAETKQAGLFNFKGMPNRDGAGWVGVYQIPGFEPGMVRDPETKSIRVFQTQDMAAAAAALRMVDVLNGPHQIIKKFGNAKQEHYTRLTGPEFAELLSRSGITLTFFSYLWGTSIKRATAWLRGWDEKGNEEFAPHAARVLLELLAADEANIDLAEAVTDRVAISKAERPARYAS